MLPNTVMAPTAKRVIQEAPLMRKVKPHPAAAETIDEEKRVKRWHSPTGAANFICGTCFYGNIKSYILEKRGKLQSNGNKERGSKDRVTNAYKG